MINVNVKLIKRRIINPLALLSVRREWIVRKGYNRIVYISVSGLDKNQRKQKITIYRKGFILGLPDVIVVRQLKYNKYGTPMYSTLKYWQVIDARKDWKLPEGIIIH